MDEMSRLRFNTVALLSAALCMCAAEYGYTQTARSGGGASAQLMQQMQQLASERTSLQAENAKLKKDLEEVRKDRDALKNGQQAVERRAKTAEGSLKESISRSQSADQELAQTKEKLQQLVAKFRETLQTLRDVEAQQTAAKQTLAVRDRDLKSCVDHNMALYKLNQEVLTHLEKQTVWSRVAQAEPFTKIKRVQLENLVDEYKDRADEQRVAPPSGPVDPPTQQAPTTTSAPAAPH
jgi:chromosome segregation ATPase